MEGPDQMKTKAAAPELRAALDNIRQVLKRWDDLPEALRAGRVRKIRQLVDVAIGDES